MSDLRTLLHESADLIPANDQRSAVDADLARGRQALRRRRARRMSAGSSLLVAAAVGAIAISSNGFQPSADRPSATSTTQSGQSSQSGQSNQGAAIEMVAYTGAQPSGYVLDKVPAGWVVRDDTATALTLAPTGAEAPEGDVDGTIDFEGTIGITTSADSGVPTGVQLDDVEVAGQPAVIAHMLGSGDTRSLFLKQPSGAYLVIQVWDGLGWDNEDIAQFASSVHVTDDVQLSVG